jgi:hypothetical protein
MAICLLDMIGLTLLGMSARWSLDEPGKRSSTYFAVADSNVAADDAHSNQAGVGLLT